MKNILITGGAGYIGSHIIEVLNKNKYKTFIIDNLSSGHKKLINEKSIFFKVSLNKVKKIKNIIKENKIDSVIHLAALLDINESQKNPKKYVYNNFIGTKKLIEACIGSNVKNFIFSSTAAVYKDGTYKVNENSVLKPKSVYGKTKLNAEKIIKKKLTKNRINYAILRFFNVCGASPSNKIGQINSYDLLFKNLASSVLKKNPKINIYGNDYNTKDGTCIRDFIHVSDISDIHFKILKKISKIKKSYILNCGYGVGRSVKEIIKAFEKNTNKKIKIIYKKRRNADLSQIIANNNKLSKLLKWKPKFNNLSVMVKTSVKWEKKLNEQIRKNIK